MLAGLRKGSQHFIVKIFLGFIALSFVLWGVGDLFRGNTDDTVATVGDHKISLSELDNAVRQQLRFYPDVNPAMIKNGVLQQIIGQRLFTAELDRLGLQIPEDILVKEITAMPNFQENGAFSKEVFEARLRSVGINEDYFLESLAKEKLSKILMDTLQASPFGLQAEAPYLYRYRNEERVVNAVSIPFDHVKNIADPSDAELVEYFEKNKESFKADEYRTAKFATVDCYDLPIDEYVTDEALQEAYDASKEQGGWQVPESAELLQLRFDTKEEAEVAYNAIKDGKSFETIAQENKIPDAAMKLGSVTKGDLPSELTREVFALEEGAYSEPLESPLGWHIFKLVERKDAYVQEFADVKDELMESHGRAETCKAVQEIFAQLDDAFAGGESLEKAAEKFDVIKVQSFGPVAQNGTSQDGNPIKGAPVYLQDERESKSHFVQQVFGLDVGGDAVVFTPNSTVFVAMQVADASPVRYRALDEVRGKVIAAWKVEQQKEASHALAKKTVEQLKAKANINELANNMGLKVESSAIKRPTSQNNMFDFASAESSAPNSLKHEVFAMDEGDITNVHVGGGAYNVAVVKEVRKVTDLDSDKAKAGIALIEEELKDQWAEDIMFSYMGVLKKLYPVEMNEKLLESYIGS